jgi:hypothetical protein
MGCNCPGSGILSAKMTSGICKHRRGSLCRHATALACVFMLNGYFPASAGAAPEEIQVYLDDFAEVGKPGLDLHTNYVPAGQYPDYHQFRLTPELSYGLSENWEVAAYWLTVKDPGGNPQTDGMKLRTRWRPKAPSADSPFYWAVNFEAGKLSRSFYPDETSAELKLIGVWRSTDWVVGTNLNLDRSLKTRPLQSATTEIDTKIAYRVIDGLQLGIENYTFMGALHYDPAQPLSSQSNYLAADFDLGGWEFNLGIGHASGQTPDRTVLKAIIGVPL